MKRFETLGSIWLIDEGAMRYCRFPKTEAGRENPEWGGPEAGPLQDAVWHEFIEWWIQPAQFYDFGDGIPFPVKPERLALKIDDERCVTAPWPEELT